ncbi:hypothetical protein BBF96_08100 [Anoxybacter fermentans]|uniref:Metalloprotease TldD/E C-terminal domain-containing protein n=1 Tax=Anoxybacter fermentans TaxID=1323375 RepID=A0A3S9SYB0_9FIRM|nr:metallopeptidase TldD-related protein [Anoxybacter fermentans]AZR73346.1 hypothetical protein BBF96_08100 [Anoxybacter fermentans]
MLTDFNLPEVKLKDKKMSLILPPNLSAEILQKFSPIFFGDRISEGMSILKDRFKEKIGSNKLTIIDDGMLHRGLASIPFDDEGFSSQKTIVIEKGIFKNALHNVFSAYKLESKSTGNGFKVDFSKLPKVTPTNLYIKPQNLSQKDIIESVEEGLYIVKLFNTDPIYQSSGSYSVSATALYIKNGQFKGFVPRIVFWGKILDYFKQIDLIGNDLEFFLVGRSDKGFGSPTIRVNNINITNY